MRRASLLTAIFTAAAAALAAVAATSAGAHPAISAAAGGLAAAAVVLIAARLSPEDGAVRRRGSTGFVDSVLRTAPETATRDALEVLPLAVILADGDLRLTHANAAARAAFPAAATGAPLSTFLRAPDLLDAAQRAASGSGSTVLEFTHLAARDSRALVAHLHPLPRGGVALMVEDQTRARHVEAVRESFVANASHELKTPLAAVIGFIETLRGPARDDPEARARFLGLMGTEADRMRRLIEDLLSLNRIETNAHVRPTEPVALGDLAREAAAALAPAAETTGATLECALAAPGPVVAGDPTQLRQLLINLIDNAIKYGGRGVTVRVSLADPAPEHPRRVGVTVADDGPGFDKTHIPRLTERFYRVDAARSRAVGGTGLGLAIAKHIVQRHGGALSIRSAKGEGAAFTIWLPQSDNL